MVAVMSNNEAAQRRGLWKLFAEDISCVFDRDPAARNRFEIVTTYPGVHALLVHRLANRLWQRGFLYLARLLSYIGRIWTSIDIHPGATIGRRFFIDHGSGVVIGETAQIGDDVTLYHGVTLGGVSSNKGKRHPTVMDHVVIGAGAKILGPITIGTGSRVGANSVVVRSVADKKTVVGIPARAVNQDEYSERSSQVIDLNHHLIPDPVAEAVSCLLDRIRVLEKSVGVHACLPDNTGPDSECDECDAVQVCEPDTIDLEPGFKKAV